MLVASGFGAGAQPVSDPPDIASAEEIESPGASPTPTSAAESSREAQIEQLRAVLSERRFERELEESRFETVQDHQRQRGLIPWRFALVVATVPLVIWGLVAPAAAPRARRWRQVAWALLALVSIASFFRFSLTDRIRDDMQIKDVYHYYIGGKYSAEIGYGRLYDCTVAMAHQQGRWWVDQLDTIRNLQTMSARPAAEIATRGIAECRSRFSTERWNQFGTDLAWFFDRMKGPTWRWMLNDHGFNPSPIWTVLATPLTNTTTAEDLRLLVQIDSLLILAALASIGWAFGFEAMCLAAIVWGTGFLWRYAWVGDAFLRQIWFSAAVIGVSCLRRGHAFTAGALLATSAGVRLFPAAFLGGYALFALRRFRETRVWSREDRRFAAGVSIAAVSLVVASLVLAGRGIEDYGRFAHNTTVLRELIIKNLAGFEALLWRIDGTTSLYWRNEVGPGLIGLDLSTALRFGVAAGSILWFWFATRRVESWEAAALGFALIPLLTSPPGYYFHFVVLAVPLCVHRPSIAVWLLAACGAWQINGFLWRDLGEQFTVASIVALVLSCAVLATMRRPAQPI
ncbi:MAG: hypothetical protein VCE43_24115 [Myxococcota bacterium]